MKCRICGHRTSSLKAMGEHYRKKHPKAMKAKHTKGSKTIRRLQDVQQKELDRLSDSIDELVSLMRKRL